MTPVRQRILQRTTATLSYLPVGSDGELTAADPGVVTVTITRSDGTALYTAAATGGAGANARTYALSAVDTALLDTLTATWKVGGVTVSVSEHDVVGGYYFTIAALRLAEPSIANAGTYPTADLVAVRDEVETAFESWTGISWVPRFTVIDVDAVYGFPLNTGLFGLRVVRWVREWSSDTVYTATDAATVAAFPANSIGLVDYYFGSRVTAGIEHGKSAPPRDLQQVAMRYARRLITRSRSGLSDRALSYTTPEGQTINVGRVGTDWRPTGDEIIDEVLRRPDLDFRPIGIA